MRDKILKALKDNACFDRTLLPAVMMARYISENKDSKYSDLTADYIKTLIYPDRNKIESKKRSEAFSKQIEAMQKMAEGRRVDAIRRGQIERLSKIIEDQRSVYENTDKISAKTGEIDRNLSERHIELQKILDDVRKETKDLLGMQMEAIKDGEKEIADKFNVAFGQVDTKLPTIADDIKSALRDFETRLAEEKAAEKANIPPEKVTEQLYIEETGQVVTIEKR